MMHTIAPQELKIIRQYQLYPSIHPWVTVKCGTCCGRVYDHAQRSTCELQKEEHANNQSRSSGGWQTQIGTRGATCFVRWSCLWQQPTQFKRELGRINSKPPTTSSSPHRVSFPHEFSAAIEHAAVHPSQMRRFIVNQFHTTTTSLSDGVPQALHNIRSRTLGTSSCSTSI
ncbi:hypothetical protein TRVL_08087 [Trypanosoma vivax]|nr:hypothetical protein TRVL_08087 [Trypanosoma vivax]